MRSSEHLLRLPVLCLICLPLLIGCGSGNPVPAAAPVSTAVPANLAGNWLLYGVIPTSDEGSNSQPGFGISFDTIGNNLVASAAISTTCTGTSIHAGFTFGNVLSGTIATDGTFTAAPPQPTSAPPGLPPSLTLTGKVPTAPGQPWSGTYSLVSTNSFCPVNQSGPFTAAPIQDVSGTYTGIGNLVASTTPTPVAISLTLKQGALLYSPNGLTPIASRLAISGSIQVQGISCFTKGTTSTVISSVVEGGPIVLNFTMDDGSAVTILGGIDDTADTQLDLNLLRINSGTCAGIYFFGPNPLVAKH